VSEVKNEKSQEAFAFRALKLYKLRADVKKCFLNMTIRDSAMV